MQHAYGEFAVDGEEEPVATDEMRAQVMEGAAGFIAVFDKVCHKHDIKRMHRPGSDLEFPKKLRLLQQTVCRCGEKYHREINPKGPQTSPPVYGWPMHRNTSKRRKNCGRSV